MFRFKNKEESVCMPHKKEQNIAKKEMLCIWSCKFKKDLHNRCAG